MILEHFKSLIKVDFPDSPPPRSKILYCFFDSRLSLLICFSMSELILRISRSFLSGQQQGMGRKISNMIFVKTNRPHYTLRGREQSHVTLFFCVFFYRLLQNYLNDCFQLTSLLHYVKGRLLSVYSI